MGLSEMLLILVKLAREPIHFKPSSMNAQSDARPKPIATLER